MHVYQTLSPRLPPDYTETSPGCAEDTSGDEFPGAPLHRYLIRAVVPVGEPGVYEDDTWTITAWAHDEDDARLRCRRAGYDPRDILSVSPVAR